MDEMTMSSNSGRKLLSRIEADGISADSVREELDRILDSEQFAATPRRRAMLRFVVEEALAGRGDRLKGYTVATMALGRGQNFDAKNDPLVRVEARRLRNDLDHYYAMDGRHNPLRISIPKGGYVPKVIAQEAGKPAPASGLKPDISQIDRPNLAKENNATGHGGRWLHAAIIAIGIATLMVIGIGVTQFSSFKGTAGDNPIKRPAVAVMPFGASDSDDEDRFLAANLADRLVTELNRYPDIRIYAAEGNSDDVPPEVSYLVRGRLKIDGPKLQVSASLIAAQTGETLWADTYNRQMSPGSILVTQDDIAADIATALGQSYGVIKNDLARELPDQFVPTMQSYECVLSAYQYRRVVPGHELAGPVLRCLQQAILVEPEYAEAWALLGYQYLDEVRFNRVEPGQRDATFAKAFEAANRATILDARNVTGWRALSAINFYQGNYQEGERLGRLALELNPNDPESLVQLGWRTAIRGNFEEGIPLIERAIERSVRPPGWFFHLLAINQLMQNNGLGMLAFAEKATVQRSLLSDAFVAMAYGLLGKTEAARHVLDQMKSSNPNYDPIKVLRTHQATEEILDAAANALRLVGWPIQEEQGSQSIN